MNRYHIRIDGIVPSKSYTYQELVTMGLFDLDDKSMNGIEIKNTMHSLFSPLKSYNFPERQSSRSRLGHIDEYGQIHINTTSKSGRNKGAYIDEYGQIVRPSVTNTPRPASSNTQTSSPRANSSSEGCWDIFLKIVEIAIAIGVLVAIFS